MMNDPLENFYVHVDSLQFTDEGLVEIQTRPIVVTSKESYAEIKNLGQGYVYAEWDNPINKEIRDKIFFKMFELYKEGKLIMVGGTRIGNVYTDRTDKRHAILTTVNDAGQVVFEDALWNVTKGYGTYHYLVLIDSD